MKEEELIMKKILLYITLFCLVVLNYTCTTHSLEYNDPTDSDQILKPLFSLGVAPSYVNEELDFTPILYQMMKENDKVRIFFTNVTNVRDEKDDTVDLVMKADMVFQDPNSSVAWWAMIASIGTLSIYVWSGLPLYVTDTTVSIKIVLYKNGKKKGTYSYSDDVSQYANFYSGSASINYEPILEGVLLKWINDIEKLKIYDYSNWGKN